MSNLNIKELKEQQAKVMNLNDYNITLKLDGSLIYYKDKKLFSPRCERSDRFKHILKILNACNFPDCFGEMFIDEPNSNVFDVSRSENWVIAKFMPIDLIDNALNYSERKKILTEKIKELNNAFIVEMKQFKTFKEGWEYVEKNNSEGLVLRNNYNWYKVKLLKEIKIQIVAHEIKKDKGCFILANGNRISGTSQTFINLYVQILERGKKPIAEVEYAFKTKNNKMFQPRLRQIVEG